MAPPKSVPRRPRGTTTYRGRSSLLRGIRRPPPSTQTVLKKKYLSLKSRTETARRVKIARLRRYGIHKRFIQLLLFQQKKKKTLKTFHLKMWDYVFPLMLCLSLKFYINLCSLSIEHQSKFYLKTIMNRRTINKVVAGRKFNIFRISKSKSKCF